MATTVLSGTSGALYYKPAGTTATFGTADVTTGTDTLTVGTYLGFRVGDPVQFSVVNTTTGGSGTGTLPAGLSTGTTYYVITYTASTGDMQVSATEGGSAVSITDVGTLSSPNKFQVAYDAFVSVGQVRDWSFEMTRAEIDVTLAVAEQPCECARDVVLVQLCAGLVRQQLCTQFHEIHTLLLRYGGARPVNSSVLDCSIDGIL